MLAIKPRPSWLQGGSLRNRVKVAESIPALQRDQGTVDCSFAGSRECANYASRVYHRLKRCSNQFLRLAAPGPFRSYNGSGTDQNPWKPDRAVVVLSLRKTR
jgi:hypothetical protein